MRGGKAGSWVGACALVAAACAFAVAGASAAALAGQPGTAARAVQTLEAEQTGLTAPVGIAFSAESNAFYVVEAPSGRGSAPGQTDVDKLTPFGRASDSMRAGSRRIAAELGDPINVAFDAKRNRLLFLGQARELLEVPVGADGELDPAKRDRREVGRFGLVDPRGLAVDPASGAVFILDRGSLRITRLEPMADGGFEQTTGSQIDLRASGLADPRGLAIDASSHHLLIRDGGSLYELSTTGEVVAVHDLGGLALVNPQGLVTAPSGDQTDDPAATSVYIADSGGGTTAATGSIVELSLAGFETVAAIDFTSQLIRTVDMAALSPPSPDPSGITYDTGNGRLVVSDAEVEEIVNGITHFQGANVWELSLGGNIQRTANISTVEPTDVPMTNEPAGAAFNPNNGHYFFCADDGTRVFDLNPGADDLLGTSDDTWTSFITDALNSDPEGIAFNTSTGTVFVADGLNREVFQYTAAGVLLGHFDVLQYGINDPNSVEFNPGSGTLFVLSDRHGGSGNQRLIAETTTGGTLIRTIDVSASNAFRPDGVAYAPASNGSAAKRFYIVDRGIDNNADPNVVDGKLYEMTAPAAAVGPFNWAANNSADFDADHLTDFGLYRGLSPADSLWYAPGTAGGGSFQIYFGATSDIPVPGDYDGDGKTDAVIYRPSSGLWYGPRTGAAQIVIQIILGGQPGDIPIPGDYDGDGDTDPAFWRPSTGLFFATSRTGSQVLLNTAFGATGDVPVPRDYDGDGTADPAIYREDVTPQHHSLWYAVLSGGGVHQIYFGAPGDVPVPGDYDGDAKADSVIFRPSTGLWYGPRTGAAQIVIQLLLGQSGDVPIPGYYDANQATDPAIFRASTGLWFSLLSGGGTKSVSGLGQAGDVPVQKRPALPGGI